MGYIYVITNQITQEQYVGQTIHSLATRFHDHVKSIKQTPHRKLQQNMIKYGKENFTIELLEECDNSLLNDKEIEWVNKLDTFRHGLNSTPGGQQRYCSPQDEEEIIAMYLEKPDFTPICKKYNISRWTVRHVLIDNNIPIISSIQSMKNTYGSKATRLDPHTKEPLEIYDSQMDAARWLVDNGLSNIADLRKIASHIKRASDMEIKMGGYYWKTQKPEKSMVQNLDDIISRNEFKILIRNYSFSMAGTILETSEYSIRRWCKRFNLPASKKEINNYSDKEWELI